MLESKDDGGESVLIHAVSSKNAAIFNAAITFVADHLNQQEVILKSTLDLGRYLWEKELMTIREKIGNKRLFVLGNDIRKAILLVS